MTDTETVVAPNPPARPKRPRPAPRQRASTPEDLGESLLKRLPTLPNGMPDRLAEMEQWDARIAARGRPADDAPAKVHNLNYNYPLAWYRRPDGDIVQLQSDPNNRTMYEDLGFVCLSPGEVKQWLEVMRPRVIAEQREKADIIKALRRYEDKTPNFTLEFDALDSDELFGDMSLERLREVHREIEEETGARIRVRRAKPETKPARDQSVEATEDIHQRVQAGRLKEVRAGQPMNFVP